ncbi:hypothetical protein ES705_10927 [subsurface metagenome]
MPEISSPRPALALTALIFGHFLNHFYAYVFLASMIIMRLPGNLNLTDSQVGLLGTIQMLVFAVFSIVVGIVGDKWLKSKTIFIPIGILFMSLHLFTATYATSMTLLIVSSVVVGFGAAFYHPVAYAAIADLYETRKGLTMSMNAAIGMIGTSITPGLVVSMDKLMGWRNFFILFGIIGLGLTVIIFFSMNYLISYRFTREEIEEKEQIKDKMKTSGRIKHWFRTEFVLIITFSIIICLFYSSFRTGIFKITNQWLSIIFVDMYSYSEINAGWITTVILIVGGLTAIVGGIVSDKYTTSITMLISLGGSAIILLLLFILGESLPGFLVIMLYFIFIAFLYFSATAGTKYVAENVPQGSRSTGISLLFAFPSILGGFFPWIFGLVKENIDNTWSIGFLSLLAIIGTFAALTLYVRDRKLGKTKKSKEILQI